MPISVGDVSLQEISLEVCSHKDDRAASQPRPIVIKSGEAGQAPSMRGDICNFQLGVTTSCSSV
jgi:hypothetical protein